jgi:predicted branched-subunit amino acid permease
MRQARGAVSSLRALYVHPEFRRGVREVGALMPAMLAWGVVSGVAMVGSGLSVPLALAMTVCVYSAGAQLSALTLMTLHAPIWLVAATAACVNLRFVIFSAGLRPYVIGLPFLRRTLLGYISVDLTYVMFMKRFGADRQARDGQVQYLVGAGVINWLCWQAATLIGIVFEQAIPTHLNLGFAGTLALLGLGCTLLVDRISAISATLAFGAALLSQKLPLRLNILVAIAVGVTAGLMLERLKPRAEQAPS